MRSGTNESAYRPHDKLTRSSATAEEPRDTLRQLKYDGFYRATACNAKHGIAIVILSVRLLDACIVTKLNDALRIF